MKNYLFILFLTPLLCISQKKKDLQETIIKYQDSVLNLKNDIQVNNVQKDIMNKEIYKIKLELENSKTENESLIKEKNRVSNNLEILSEDLNNLEKNKQDNIKKINLLQQEIYQYKDSLTAQEKQYQLLLNQKESDENDENVKQKKGKYAFDIHVEKTKNENKQTSNILTSNSKFSKSNIHGVWELSFNRTILTRGNNWNCDRNDLFLINPSNLSNRKVWRKYDSQEYIQKQMRKREQKSFFINKLSFMKPNICTIELMSGESITTIYEVIEEKPGEVVDVGSYKINYINTDKDEFSICVSIYNSSYYYSYDFESLIRLFSLTYSDFQDLRIKNVQYGDYDHFTNKYGVMGFLK